jgi:phosphoribosylformylglycinamidine synthase
MSKTVNVIILTGFGFNCEQETASGFKSCGADVSLTHVNDLLACPKSLLNYDILTIGGGFSYGDHLGAATVMALRLKSRLAAELRAFVADGKLIIGICNGFQILARLGLVPALGGIDFIPQVALTQNDSGVFRDAWVSLRCDPLSPCVFTRGIEVIALPIRHGEGKLVPVDAATMDTIEQQHLVAMRYISSITGMTTDVFPDNPNGSANGIAGICDPTGRVFGMMPHPEAYLSPYNYCHWQRQKINHCLPLMGEGQKIFANAVAYVENQN